MIPLWIRLWIGLAVVAVALVAGIAVQASFDAEKQSAPPRRERPVGGRSTGLPAPAAVTGADPDGTGELVAVVEYLSEQDRLERERQAVAAYLDALEQTRLADLEAARVAASRRAPSAPAPSGGARAPHSDAWWHGVAICEQGGRNDPYYGYFSWMDGSAAGMTWDQQVAKSNALLSTVNSESPAWAPVCVAAGYAASPSG